MKDRLKTVAWGFVGAGLALALAYGALMVSHGEAAYQYILRAEQARAQQQAPQAPK